MIYAFGDCELDTSLYELRRAGRTCPVEPQVFDLLRFLIDQRDRVVTRQEMLDAVWPGRFVSEATLSSRIMAARKAVGDSGSRQTLIRTMHGRGVRFVGEVEERTDTAVPSDGLERPVTRYARSGSVNIAYQVVGDGPVDIVFVMGWVSHLEMFWQEPSFARFLRRLAGFARLIVFDKRGTGLSDRVPLEQLPTLEQRMDDVRAVMDAAGSRRAVLLGVSEGAPMCALFAATWPQRAAGLIVVGGYARLVAAPGYPWGRTVEERDRFMARVEREWGGPVGLDVRAPSRIDDREFRDWWATYLRMGASPGAVLALMRMNNAIDVRDILPAIRVPTLIIHRAGELTIPVGQARYLAREIPGAEYVELPGIDHLPFVGAQEEILEPIERFVGQIHPAEAPRETLATVLVVSGDDLAASPIEVEIRRHGGRTRPAAHPGVVATFDGPARAIRAALGVVGSLPGVASAAVHTGACELQGENLAGPALAMALAILEDTPRGQVRVSSTTHDLVAGAGLTFRALGLSVVAEGAGRREVFAVETEAR